MRSPFAHTDKTVDRGSRILTAAALLTVLSFLATLEQGFRSGEIYAYAAKPAEAIVSASNNMVQYFENQAAEQEAREAAHAELLKMQREKKEAESKSETKTIIEINNNDTTTRTQTQQQPAQETTQTQPYQFKSKSAEEIQAEQDAFRAQWEADVAKRQAEWDAEMETRRQEWQTDWETDSAARNAEWDAEAAAGFEAFRKANDPNYQE